MMSHRPSFDVARAISPLGFDDFIHRHWAQEPLHISRNDAAFYADLFSLSDLDALLVQSRITSRDLRVASKRSGLAYDAMHALDRPEPLRNRGPQLGALHEAYRDGKSVIVEMRRLWPQVDHLSRSLEQTFRRGSSAELYLTPPRAQAFDVHFDLVEIFLLQLDGAKTWHVYDPIVEAPSSAHGDDRNCADRVGDPKWVFEVRAGDLLYIPYGFPHQGLTSGESSLHISFGVKRLHLHDVLKTVVDLAARDHALLRRSLQGKFADLGGPSLEADVDECLRLLRGGTLVERAIEQIEDSFLADLDQAPDGQFAEIDGLDRIDAGTLLERRADQLCIVRCQGGSATLRFVEGGVSGPSWLEEPFRWIAATPRFRPAEIPGDMGGDGKLVLARRLVKEGLLRKARDAADGAS